MTTATTTTHAARWYLTNGFENKIVFSSADHASEHAAYLSDRIAAHPLDGRRTRTNYVINLTNELVATRHAVDVLTS